MDNVCLINLVEDILIDLYNMVYVFFIIMIFSFVDNVLIVNYE